MKNIEVVLLNNEVVLPGQTLYGKVVCQNTDSFDVRSINYYPPMGKYKYTMLKD